MANKKDLNSSMTVDSQGTENLEDGTPPESVNNSNGEQSQNSTATVMTPEQRVERVEKMRKATRRRLLTIEATMNVELAKENVDYDKIKELLTELNAVFDEMVRQDDMILMEKAAWMTDDEADKDLEERLHYNKKVADITARVTELGKKRSTTVIGEPIDISAGQSNIKFADINIEKFSGDPQDWLRFWGQFKKIDENPKMSDSDKMLRLSHAMEKGSTAYNVIAPFAGSNASYSEALETLKRRFANPHFLMQVYINRLLVLCINNGSGKEKLDFGTLYASVDSSLRALRTLELNKADSDVWLYPLVEAALPEDVLASWHRSPEYGGGQSSGLKKLLEYMEREVNIQQQGGLAKGFRDGLKHSTTEKAGRPTSTAKTNSHVGIRKRTMTTTMGFHNSSMKQKGCVFCAKDHPSKECRNANKLSLDKRREAMQKRGCCYICLEESHISRDCRNKSKIKCDLCGRSHLTIFCFGSKKTADGPTPEKQRRTESSTSSSLVNQVSDGDVCLPTLVFTVLSGNKQKRVRSFMDSGSSRSYILKRTAQELGLTALSEEKTIHVLFGGSISEPIKHKVFDVELRDEMGSGEASILVRDHHQICSPLSQIDRLASYMRTELKSKGIRLSDLGHKTPEIEVLIGADWFGHILTGRKTLLSNGLIAIETLFGWTLMGEVMGNKVCPLVKTVTMSVIDSSLKCLWELDSLGIRDSLEILSAEEKEERSKREFLNGVVRDSDGRYIVRLPWKLNHPELTSNREIAMSRLIGTSNKLKTNGLLVNYHKLFKEWESESFIEKTEGTGKNLSYSPHRAVIKTESSTTPVRPVFDCSCKGKGRVSLNDCLEKGQSYILKIPQVLLRFREKRVGFVADIRKAFQMIGVCPEDRDALRFLWWDSVQMNQVMEYRHARVPFGATCSPFILGAILELHILSVADQRKEVAKRLWGSLYVDNVCSSEDTEKQYLEFRHTSVKILDEAKMDLRMWLSNVEGLGDKETRFVSVLGLKWDRVSDELYVNIKNSPLPETITKRTVLSELAKVYDPMGFVAPALLPIKILLQTTWVGKLKWDEPLPVADQDKFKGWHKELQLLSEIRIPRALSITCVDRAHWQLHTFSDGSKYAFGCITFLRIDYGDFVQVKLLSSHSRVAPLKPMTIPRLELMGCLIASRQSADIKKSLELEGIRQFFWTDSTTALAWIKRNKLWGTFVGNRTNEICKLTNIEDWYHCPGELNPADLPSRGCTPRELVQMKWYEGPSWLYAGMKDWPSNLEIYDENDISSELKKTPVKIIALANVVTKFINPGSTYAFYSIVRIHAWVLRVVNNWRKFPRRSGALKLDEIERAEIDVLLQIQADAFSVDEQQARLKTLETINDEYGLIRCKTRLTYLPDDKSFRLPVILPGKHPLVCRLIFDMHKAYCHAGVGFLSTKLREKYWILNSRQSIKSITTRCYRCRKLTARPTVTPTAPLPLDRIKNAEVFEVTGIDLAGPFVTKNGKKVWLSLFTCAIYRAVGIYVLTSLSTTAFLNCLYKFIDKYRRPARIYSDNGTNFRGTDNLFGQMNWEQIFADYQVKRIRWKFNPPTASWWGGWWERLIGVMKNLLRKEIGTVILTKKELVTVVKRVEEVMNGRPLTYVSEDPAELEPLTPNHFLRPFGNAQFPEMDLVDGGELRTRYKYLKAVKEALKIRFKKEYIALLVSRHPKKPTRVLRVGEMVIVGSDNQKRSVWPLGRIIELIHGTDGFARVAKVKTKDGELLRPLQRLYALEADDTEPEVSMGEHRSLYGRTLKRPDRLGM